MNTSRIIMGSTCSMQRHPDEYNRSSSKKNSSRGNVSGSYIYLYLHIFGRVRVHISHFDSHSDSSLLLLPSIVSIQLLINRQNRSSQEYVGGGTCARNSLRHSVVSAVRLVWNDCLCCG